MDDSVRSAVVRYQFLGDEIVLSAHARARLDSEPPPHQAFTQCFPPLVPYIDMAILGAVEARVHQSFSILIGDFGPSVGLGFLCPSSALSGIVSEVFVVIVFGKQGPARGRYNSVLGQEYLA